MSAFGESIEDFGTKRQSIEYLKLDSKEGIIKKAVKMSEAQEYADILSAGAPTLPKDLSKLNPEDYFNILFSAINMPKLLGIKLVENTYEGKSKKEWHIKYINNKNKMFILKCGWKTRTFLNIINSLSSIEGNVGVIKIEVYLNKKNFAAINVLQNGEKVGWKYQIEEIPIDEPIILPSGEILKDAETQEPVKDATKRMRFTSDLVDLLNKKLGYDPTQEAAPAEQQPMAQPNYAQASAPVYNAPVNNNGYANKPANGAAPQQQHEPAIDYSNMPPVEEYEPIAAWN